MASWNAFLLQSENESWSSVAANGLKGLQVYGNEMEVNEREILNTM